MAIVPGMVYEAARKVEESHTAAAIDGGKFPHVLSTPHLIGWIETSAHEALLAELTGSQGSVGTAIQVKHLAATPVGMQVKIRVELMEVSGRRLFFKVEAWDDTEKIIDGDHERFIIDVERFTQKVEQKKAAWQIKAGW